MDKSQAQNEDYLDALKMCIGLDSTQRLSIPKTQLYIKTTQKEIDIMLEKYPEYTLDEIMAATFTVEQTYEGIKIILIGPDWQTEGI